MIWENFKSHFHESWHSKIKPFIESEACDKIYAKLKEDGRRGVKIAPNSNLTFRAFQETPLNNINLVILGFCPYHTFTKDGSPIADGLAFSSSITGKLPPSLEKMYEGWEEEFNNGLNLNYYKSPDLLYLASQGILLLNSSLTVPMGKAGAHQSVWEPFTKYLLEEVLIYLGVPYILIGKDAQYYKRYMTPLTHGQIYTCEHPSFASRSSSIWNTEGVFKKATEIVKQNNGIQLKWLCTQEEINIINLPF